MILNGVKQLAGFFKQNKNKIFFRVLFLNFAFLTCLVFIYQTAIYFYFNKSYNQKATDVFVSNAMQTKNLIDKTVLKTQFEILNTYFNAAVQPSDSLSKFVSAGKLTSAEILDISRIMHKLLYLYPRIEEIKIYSPQNNLIFRNGFVIYLDDVSLETQSNEYAAPFQVYHKSQQRQAWIYNESTRSISFMLALPYFSFNDTVYSVICFDTSIDSFINLSDGSLGFALYDSDGTALYADESLSSESYSEEIAQMEASGETQQIITQGRGKTNVRMLAKSDYAGLYYLFSTQSDNLTGTFLLSVLGLLLMNIALLGVFFIVSYILTKQMHKPLERIIMAARNSVTATEHNSDDYNLLDSTVENVHVLRSKIDSNSGIIYENIVRSLLDGTFSGTQFAANYKTSKISFDYDYVFAVIIKLFDNSSEQISSTVSSLLLEENDKFKIYPVYFPRRNEICVAVNIMCNDANIVSEHLRKRLCEISAFKFNIFTGNVYDLHEQNIHLSMGEAESIAEYSYIMENATVLDYKAYTNTDFVAALDHGSSLEFIERALQNKNTQTAHQKCLEYLDALTSFNYDITYIKKSVLDIILCIKTVLAHASAVQCIEVAELSSRSMQNNIFELKQHLSQVVFPAIEQHYDNIKDDVSLENQLMRVINESPYESITLDYIASKLNMRNSAFSKAFKAMSNINFIDYVKNMKLEYAAKLLSESGLSVKDISARLGYNTPHYFIKIFKERYSCTPKQYQNMRIAEALRHHNETNAENNL